MSEFYCSQCGRYRSALLLAIDKVRRKVCSLCTERATQNQKASEQTRLSRGRSNAEGYRRGKHIPKAWSQ